LAETVLPFVGPESAVGAKAELFCDAITTIVGLLEAGAVHPSPLLPAAMVSEQSQITRLERQLDEVLRAGHLHSISKRPRIDLKYEESVTEVSRARRLTSGTYTHLASHSECWQRQTLSGVQPRRVLARFSEDDYAIYENGVYARLLDGLDNHLTTRLQRLEALREGLELALRFTESTDLHFRLTREICTLWGQTYNPEQTKQQLEVAQNTLATLSSQLKSVRGLKQSGLYLLVPRALRVGASLHRTNILTHDQHYRHLALLWEELQHARQFAHRTPAEVLAANQLLEQNYSQYLGLVLRHALQRFGFDQGESVLWAGHSLTTRRSGLDWQLIADDELILELVPWACLHALPDDVAHTPRHRVVCWPGVELGECLEAALTGSALRLSPMDLYVVERLGALLDEALSRLLLERYAVPIQPLPAPVVAEAQSIPGIRVQGKCLQVLNLLKDEAAARLQALIVKHARPELEQSFVRRLNEMRTLSLCPVCDKSAEIVNQADDGFSSHCHSCGCRRYWRRAKPGHWEYQQLLGEVEAFRIYGRRSLVFSLQSSPRGSRGSPH
jgi:hypothetical protein